MSFDCNYDWESYCSDNLFSNNDTTRNVCDNSPITDDKIFPKCSNLYISTTTKISYLSTSIDIFDVFWRIPIMDYTTLSSGFVKKQIKYTFKNSEHANETLQKLDKYKLYTIQQISYLNNPEKNIYKDIRKLNIGLSEKDIISVRSKKKSAFYNCFALILRFYDDEINTYREAHIKVFNTGKLELPGIKSKKNHIFILTKLIEILNSICNLKVDYLNKHETVLINSNFTCGYCLNRDKFANILKIKYNIETSYDPCSYPGIMSKIYVGTRKNKISFMVFRTGSVLIVGKCDEDDINELYQKLINIFKNEYFNILVESAIVVNKKSINKNPKKFKTISRKINS